MEVSEITLLLVHPIFSILLSFHRHQLLRQRSLSRQRIHQQVHPQPARNHFRPEPWVPCTFARK